MTSSVGDLDQSSFKEVEGVNALLKWKEGNGGLRVETTLSKEFFCKGKNRAIAGGRSGVIKYSGYF